jgi:hypothetical protein
VTTVCLDGLLQEGKEICLVDDRREHSVEVTVVS